MNLRFWCFVLVVFLSIPGFAQLPVDTSLRVVDLNEFVVRQHAKRATIKRSRLHHTSLLVRAHSQKQRSWDSILVMTRFPALSSRPIVLHSVSSRIPGLDTSMLDLFLTVLQIHDGDTLLRRIPITYADLERRGTRFRLDLRDEVIALKPVPFYLGFSFRTKKLPNDVSFPFYYTLGGDGVTILMHNNRWIFIEGNNQHVFPFQVQYLETSN